MKPLLLLHFRADVNTNDIWRAAIQSGWSTDRIHDHDAGERAKDRDVVRYYGNTLHASRIEDQLPFRFLPLDLTILTKTPFSKRRISLIRLDAFTMVHEPTFIKPAQEKWFPARVYQPGEMPAPDGGTLPSDLIYIQDPVTFINEVRCFVLDGKVQTASYYRVSKEYCPVGIDETGWTQEIDDMAAQLAPSYPRGVVLDFGYTDRGEWSFIEPNEAWASGIYGCDPVKCLDVIAASQVDKA